MAGKDTDKGNAAVSTMEAIYALEGYVRAGGGSGSLLINKGVFSSNLVFHKYISELYGLRGNYGRIADRVARETVPPPVWKG